MSLLGKLATETGTPVWAERFGRFRAYAREPLVVQPAPALPALYPIPADGFRDAAPIRFTLSKCATVTVSVADFSRTLSLRPGRHAVTWWPGRRRPGTYRGRLSAAGVLGKTASRALPPIVIKRDTTAPSLALDLDGTRLTWRASDEGTPWLRFRLLLERTGARELVDVGRQRLSGSARVEVACGPWHVTLLASDSAGNLARAPIGVLGEGLPPGACELWTEPYATWRPLPRAGTDAAPAPLP